jgi:hypothetical protein
VIIVDEAGMTNDRDLSRLALGVQRAGAKLVLVGDHRQLDAIGPGGALHALLDRRPELVTTLDENVRQRDPAERIALAELRDGSVPDAVAWYAENDRIHTAPTRTDTMVAMADAWAADLGNGDGNALLAWRRDDVADLNRLARDRYDRAGLLSGPDLVAPGGRTYAAGDRVVALAPNPYARIVTSQQLTITHVDPDQQTLEVRTRDGRDITLAGRAIDQQRLDHAYALTVHRAQGATYDTAHVMAAGGGRELGYVAMSRARHHTTIHATADDPAQAVDDLQGDWGVPHHQRWITDTPTIEAGLEPEPEQPDQAKVTRMRQRLDRLTPTSVAALPTACQNAQLRLEGLRGELVNLHRGAGRWRNTPEADAARQLRRARQAVDQAEHQTEIPGLGRRQRRTLTRTLEETRAVMQRAEQRWQEIGQPVADRLRHEIRRSEIHVTNLRRDEMVNRLDHIQERHLHRDGPIIDRQPPGIEGPDLGLGL